MKLIKFKDVMLQTTLGRTTIYKYITEGTFPRPIKLGGRVVAWVESEVQEWIQQKIKQPPNWEEQERALERNTNYGFTTIEIHSSM
ncbi:AlpA family transcriptional regulator [Arsukibacterium indicum]|uniref:AlpA family transcriptional regulator n=1 Tax=Arsukibacterium indicum TaxID=2848612 RepID=A0ABS6MNV5_9GAMM|nr:AlpA family transcriptional regulator [Arsukibacterium indicum]MBV2130478.1 AlpA family transcriptional regulator [Arsukibacterium indicum]